MPATKSICTVRPSGSTCEDWNGIGCTSTIPGVGTTTCGSIGPRQGRRRRRSKRCRRDRRPGRSACRRRGPEGSCRCLRGLGCRRRREEGPPTSRPRPPPRTPRSRAPRARGRSRGWFEPVAASRTPSVGVGACPSLEVRRAGAGARFPNLLQPGQEPTDTLMERVPNARGPTMATRPASDPVSVPAGIAIFCALALVTGLALLDGASFGVAMPAMAIAALRLGLPARAQAARARLSPGTSAPDQVEPGVNAAPPRRDFIGVASIVLASKPPQIIDAGSGPHS